VGGRGRARQRSAALTLGAGGTPAKRKGLARIARDSPVKDSTLVRERQRYIFSTIALPNSEHLSSFAPVVSRSKS
jgi:hypothetical protein